MSETQYIEYSQWLGMPADRITPYERLTDEQKADLTNSLTYDRFQLYKAWQVFKETLRRSFGNTLFKP